ncbi:MAG: class I SAM-dependent methyltransferase [Chitinivibrionales bacterium]|nr:class I SAM-dependent methyltransferase [Chitinivibrionales bacterium]
MYTSIKKAFRFLKRKTLFNNRSELVNFIIGSNEYETYLEIGCSKDKTFGSVLAKKKVGVDPQSGGTVRATSDEFFKKNREFFDIIFLDGLHHSVQLEKDVDNALKCLSANGTIVIHDANPLTEEAQQVPRKSKGGIWNGDVWKTIVALRTRADIDLAVGAFDYGCAVLIPRNNTDLLILNKDISDLTYSDLDKNRKKWLRLKSPSKLSRFMRNESN